MNYEEILGPRFVHLLHNTGVKKLTQAFEKELAVTVGKVQPPREWPFHMQSEIDQYRQRIQELMRALQNSDAEIAALTQSRQEMADAKSAKEKECEALVRKVQALELELHAPVDMLLWCPKCNTQHVDKGEYRDTVTHRTHRCMHCGYMWRISDRATRGVANINSKGAFDKDARPRVWAGENFEKMKKHFYDLYEAHETLKRAYTNLSKREETALLKEYRTRYKRLKTCVEVMQAEITMAEKALKEPEENGPQTRMDTR